MNNEQIKETVIESRRQMLAWLLDDLRVMHECGVQTEGTNALVAHQVHRLGGLAAVW
jgi:hypothetical protein